MKPLPLLSLLATGFLLALGFQNCGTDTGNPYSITSPAYSAPIYEASALTLTNQLCNKVNRCGNAPFSECFSIVKTQTGVGGKFGGSTFSTMASLASEELAGANVPNPVSLRSCQNAIEALACTDPKVMAGYDTTSGAPYSGINAMVPVGSGCESVFRH